MKSEPTEIERGLECAIIRMALSAQEVEPSPSDLATMRRLTKTLQRCLRVADIELGKKKLHCRSEKTIKGGAAAVA